MFIFYCVYFADQKKDARVWQISDSKILRKTDVKKLIPKISEEFTLVIIWPHQMLGLKGSRYASVTNSFFLKLDKITYRKVFCKNDVWKIKFESLKNEFVQYHLSEQLQGVFWKSNHYKNAGEIFVKYVLKNTNQGKLYALLIWTPSLLLCKDVR